MEDLLGLLLRVNEDCRVSHLDNRKAGLPYTIAGNVGQATEEIPSDLLSGKPKF